MHFIKIKSFIFGLVFVLVSCGGGDESSSVNSPIDVPSSPSIESPSVESPSTGENSGAEKPPIEETAENETSEKFIARAIAGSGSIDLKSTPQKLTFSGCLPKGKTVDPRVLGAAHFLTNLSGQEYRLMSFAYHMDTEGLRAGETVESDIGFTVLPKTKLVALNSGEETMITHRYDVTTDDRGIFRMLLPAGGIPIRPDMRLSVASVSAIFPVNGSGAPIIDDDRLSNGKFMRVCYETEVVRAEGPAVASYRSPYRDRSFVPSAGRQVAPYTDFQNTSGKSIRVYGIAPFLSNMSSNVASEHSMRVLVNGLQIQEIKLPPHVPGVTTPSHPIVSDVSIALNPGDILSVRGIISPSQAIVYDFAAFIFADEGLTVVNEKLNALKIDVNGDGYDDILDIDNMGSVWVSIMVGDGLQNTQTEWSSFLRNAHLEVIYGTSPPVIRATNSAGMCLNLKTQPIKWRFIYDYCENSSPSTEDDVWGDFNGDGWPDRLRVSSSPTGYLVALGGVNGLRAETPWVQGYGAVERMFASDSNDDGKTDLVTEWSDITGPRCVLWISTGTDFIMSNCKR